MWSILSNPKTIFLSVMLTGQFAAGLMAIGTWTIIAVRRRAGLPILRQQPAYEAPWTLIDVVAMLALTATTHALLQWSLAASNSPASENDPAAALVQRLLLFSIASLISFAIMLCFVPLRTGATLRDLGFRCDRLWNDLLTGLIAAPTLLVPVLCIQMLLTQIWKPSQHMLIKLLQESATPTVFQISAFSAVLVAPVVEEFFFRVLLQGWLESVIARQNANRHALHIQSAPTHQDHGGEQAIFPESNSVTENPYLSPSAFSAGTEVEIRTQITHPSYAAIVLTAVLFALAHAGNGPDPVPLFVLATGLGYLYQRQRSILPCIIVHATLNGMTFLNLWLIQQGG